MEDDFTVCFYRVYPAHVSASRLCVSLPDVFHMTACVSWTTQRLLNQREPLWSKWNKTSVLKFPGVVHSVRCGLRCVSGVVYIVWSTLCVQSHGASERYLGRELGREGGFGEPLDLKVSLALKENTE